MEVIKSIEVNYLIEDRACELGLAELNIVTGKIVYSDPDIEYIITGKENHEHIQQAQEENE